MAAMAAESDVATRVIAAVAAPDRLRLVGALSEGPLPAHELASRLGIDEATVARHARPLEALALLERAVGEDGRITYALRREGEIWDDEWANLPVPVRRELAAGALAQFYAAALAASDAGGFDRRDMHLSRSPLRLDEKGWREAASIMFGAYTALEELAGAAVEEPSVRATAIMLLFTDEPAPARVPAPAFSESEGRDRVVELAQEVREALGSGSGSWLEIVALADQLRVVARAAALATVEE